jgi:hypothetical protein
MPSVLARSTDKRELTPERFGTMKTSE